MRLLWHIVAKDLRRLAWPWLAWLAVFTGWAVWTSQHGPLARTVFSLPVGGLVLVGAFALAGAVGLEDPVAESGAFWRTRPIGRVRHLAAKLSAAILAIGIVPLVILRLALWGGGTWPGENGIDQALLLPLIVPALAIASLAKDLGLFLLYSAFLFVVHHSVSMFLVPPVGSLAPAERIFWMNLPAWPFMAVVLVFHTLTGLTRHAWCLIAAAFGAMAGLSGWLWLSVGTR